MENVLVWWMNDIRCENILLFHPFTGNILMIVGGRSHNPRKTEDKAYALSLKPSSVDIPSCLETICDYPLYVEAPLMAIFEDGLPTICGGRDENSSPVTYHRECYKFNVTENGWGLPLGSKNFQGVHTGK